MALESYIGLQQSLSPGLIALIVVLSTWSLIWKGFALWKSARLFQPVWFIVLLVVNTVGILEILYIFIFSEWRGSKNADKTKKTSKGKTSKRSRS